MFVVAANGHALVIDPFQKEGCLDDLVLDAILLTHEHYDHITGVNYFHKLTGAPVISSAACAEGCHDSKRNLSRYSEIITEMQKWAAESSAPVAEFVCEANETFEGELTMLWQGHEVKLFECPGHSKGSIGILIDGSMLFAGDSLLKDIPTALNLPGGSRRQWEETGKPQMQAIDPAVMVYPGHFEAFKLSDYKYW